MQTLPRNLRTRNSVNCKASKKWKTTKLADGCIFPQKGNENWKCSSGYQRPMNHSSQVEAVRSCVSRGDRRYGSWWEVTQRSVCVGGEWAAWATWDINMHLNWVTARSSRVSGAGTFQNIPELSCGLLLPTYRRGSRRRTVGSSHFHALGIRRL